MAMPFAPVSIKTKRSSEEVPVTKHLKLATISIVYSVSMVLMLTAVGVALFRESLGYPEILGIVLAVASLIFLVRFA
jgi:small multidrug resistance pump